MRLSLVSILVALILICVGVGFFYFHSTGNTSPYTTPAAEPPGHGVVGNAKLDTDPFDVTITYTDQGYSPADITIKQGQRVRFLNESNTTTWPASGLHPTHTLYPEKEPSDCLGSSFDSCHELSSSEFFDFTFYYPGTWRFHDHLHPYDTGSITVISDTASSTGTATTPSPASP